MDKVREEFEGWAKGAGYLVIKEDDGDYSFQHMRHAWESWKASRAALCVELPKIHNLAVISDPLMGADDIKWALEDAGVQYK